MITTCAKGSFEVQATPHPPYDESDGISLGRMTFQKQFAGDLEATSVVEMMAARTPVATSAGYVALERVRGWLHGREGGFVLQHSATMNRGASTLALSVVPDSGTGELAGIAGDMRIEIIERKHFYAFDYTLERP
jgi:hypothetical protein